MKKFTKIRSIGHSRNTDTVRNPEDNLIFKEKLDGCLPYNQRINTDKGKIPIGKIVNQEMDVKALSYNNNSNKLEYKQITDYYKNGSSDEWLEILFDGHVESSTLKLTPNHEVYTSKGKKQAGDLTTEDKLLISHPKAQGQLKSLITGTILGDASVSFLKKNGLMSITHGQNQHDYAQWKEKQLDEIVTSSETYMSAYDENHLETEKYRFRTKSLATFENYRWVEHDKQVPENLELDWRTVAIWYADDGSLIKGNNNQRCRAAFHTQSFNKESINNLVNSFEKLGISPRVANYGKGFLLEINSDDSEKLFTNIAKFIPNCVNRKIPEKYVSREENWNIEFKPKTAQITQIKDYEPHNNQKFDIEVKDNHNYFTKHVLVSNSNFRFNVINHDGEKKFLFGSKNVEYKKNGEPDYEENVDDRFKDAINYIRENYDPKDFAIGYTYFAENMVKHSLEYDWQNTPQVIAFDIYEHETGEYLSWPSVKQIFSDLGFPTAPVVDEMTVEEFEPEDYEIPESNYRDGKMEGVVIINQDQEEDSRSGFNTRAKMVTEEFKEKHKKSTGARQSKEAVHGHEKIVSKYCTSGRIRKHIGKMRDEGRDLGKELMGSQEDSEGLPIRIAVDIIEEEADHIVRRNDEMNWKNYRSLIADRCLRVIEEEMQKEGYGQEQE